MTKRHDKGVWQKFLQTMGLSRGFSTLHLLKLIGLMIFFLLETYNQLPIVTNEGELGRFTYS